MVSDDHKTPPYRVDTSRLTAASDAMMESVRRKNNPAMFAHERLMGIVSTFEKQLDPDQEIGARVISGPSQAFHVERFGYSAPDLLVFHGVDSDGNPITLVQHHSQLNLALMALPKRHEPARRIGFVV